MVEDNAFLCRLKFAVLHCFSGGWRDSVHLRRTEECRGKLTKDDCTLLFKTKG